MRQTLATSFCLIALTLSLHAQVPVTVVNGASFQPGFPIAPGSYAQVFGNFAGFPRASADLTGPLPTSLGGVQVFVQGVAAPLYATSEQVVAFVVPQAAQVGRREIQVTRDGRVVGQGRFDVFAEAPGIFFGIVDGLNAGGVRRARDNAYALSATPAQRGGVITIALTGAGTGLSRSIPDGQAPTELVETVEKPEVYISVDRAEVLFSGLMPLFPGLWQINARVPDKPYIAGPVPLFVRYRGMTSNPVIFWVEP